MYGVEPIKRGAKAYWARYAPNSRAWERIARRAIAPPPEKKKNIYYEVGM